MAFAGVGPHSSREPMPAREVERAVVVPKGWTELTFALGSLAADQAWDAEGQPMPLDVPLRALTVRMGVRMGLAPGFEVYASLPWHRQRGFVLQHGFGVAELGARIALQRAEAPSRSVGIEVGARVPAGFVGGEGSTPGRGPEGGRVPLSTGTGDLVVALLGRRAVDGVLFEGRLEGVLRAPGRPAWSVERFDPGDVVTARTRVLLQAGPVAVGPIGELSARSPVRTAPERGRWAPIRRSGGAGGSAGVQVLAQISRGFELEGTFEASLFGQDAAWVWVPSVHPPRTRGLTIAGRGRF